MPDELESLQNEIVQNTEETVSAKQIKFALEEKWKEEGNSEDGGDGMKEGMTQDQATQDTTGASTMIGSQELEQIMLERDEFLDHLKRLQAEFDNYRKRIQREREELSAYMLQGFMAQLLPVADAFHRAMETAGQTADIESYRQGVEMVYKQLMNILKESGLEKIETVGQKFDPNLHEAVSQVESAEHEPGAIVTEFSPGYQLKERVIQAPKVQVAIAPAQQTMTSEEASEEANQEMK